MKKNYIFLVFLICNIQASNQGLVLSSNFLGSNFTKQGGFNFQMTLPVIGIGVTAFSLYQLKKSQLDSELTSELTPQKISYKTLGLVAGIFSVGALVHLIKPEISKPVLNWIIDNAKKASFLGYGLLVMYQGYQSHLMFDQDIKKIMPFFKCLEKQDKEVCKFFVEKMKESKILKNKDGEVVVAIDALDASSFSKMNGIFFDFLDKRRSGKGVGDLSNAISSYMLNLSSNTRAIDDNMNNIKNNEIPLKNILLLYSLENNHYGIKNNDILDYANILYISTAEMIVKFNNTNLYEIPKSDLSGESVFVRDFCFDELPLDAKLYLLLLTERIRKISKYDLFFNEKEMKFIEKWKEIFSLLNKRYFYHGLEKSNS